MYIYIHSDGIPVGGVNIDSDWSVCLNNFVFDRKKFPNPEKIAPYFHEQGIKIIVVMLYLCSGPLAL